MFRRTTIRYSWSLSNEPGKLAEDGLITEEEFKAKKAELLARL